MGAAAQGSAQLKALRRNYSSKALQLVHRLAIMSQQTSIVIDNAPMSTKDTHPTFEPQDSQLASSVGSTYEPLVLTSEDLSNYKRDGFPHIKGFYTGDELIHLRECLEEVQHTPEEDGGQMMYFEEGSGGQGRLLSRVEDFCRRNKQMEALFCGNTSKLAMACGDLIGEEVVLFKDKINFKLPGGDGFKAHQDQAAGWGKYIDWFMSIGVFVDPSTEEHGALEVASGYHKDGLLGEEWTPIVDLDLPYQMVECEPGDALFFDSYVPHRSALNNSDKSRRALFITYNKASEGYKLPDYYEDKRRDFPPDIERPEGVVYTYRV